VVCSAPESLSKVFSSAWSWSIWVRNQGCLYCSLGHSIESTYPSHDPHLNSWRLILEWYYM
jgi:hypothetical protein